ncbi:MAG TPA: HEPN domain-containing protein [Acidimicrobiia bacterium]|jgi:HEPN domain-containing protein
MNELDDLIAKRFIEAVQTDRPMAEKWISDARRHLQAAQAIETIDPSGVYVLAYDAARKAVAAALLMTGHRVRGRPGSHQALAQYAEVLGRETGEPAFKQFDRLRRERNRSEYGARSFGKAEVNEAIKTAEAILETCARQI